jgi:hypothetical protein
MLLATDFIIMRGVQASGRVSHPLDRKPIRVATILAEDLFNNLGHALIHKKTVFLEDYMHDWNWNNGLFRYYTRVAEVADVLVVFAEKEVVFCSQCGAKKASLTGACTNSCS